MVDFSVLCFVGPNVQQQVLHGPVAFGHLPVVDGQIRNAELGIGPLGQLPSLEVGDGERVRQHGLFFQVAHEAMAGARGDEVGEEHGVEEDALGAQDHDLHEPAGLGHLEEGEQVHALVVRLFEQRLDPAVVALHPAQRVQVAEHAGHHAGDAGYGLQEHHADQPFPLAHGVGLGSGHGVLVACYLWLLDIVLVSSCDVGSPA